jgi:transposase
MFRVFARLVGLHGAVVEDVELDGDVVVVHVRARARERDRCGRCGRRSPGYDQGEGRRRWRALDLGAVQAYVEAGAPRVRCRDHGVVVARVRWARHGAWHTRHFEDQAAWLATQCSKSAITRLMRVSWRGVGGILSRVVADRRARVADPLEGLRRIGIDEISYRRGQRYIMGVIDHDSGRLVWAADGRDATILGEFFTALGPERCQRIALVSCDQGSWIRRALAEHCPEAIVCMDPFHVVRLATDALDVVRREVWNAARARKDAAGARWLKGARRALWKAPERLTGRQQTKLAQIQATNRRLYRAYLLKEQLRIVFHEPRPEGAIELLDAWVAWAQRSRLPSFVKLAATIRADREAIVATLTHRLQRPHGGGQHHHPPDHPPRLRLSLRRGADRAGDAHPRRTLPAPPRPLSHVTDPRKRQERPKWPL